MKHADGGTYNSSGWQSWPPVESGNWGLVYVTQGHLRGCFVYYDDEEDVDEAIVYVGRPLQSAGYMVPLGCLRQPPFAGAMRSPSAPTFWVPDNEPLPAPAAMPATITCPHCKDTITPSHPAPACPLVTELNKNDEIFSAKKPAAPPAPPAPTRAPDARRPGAGVESATPAPTLSGTGLPRGPPLTRGSHYLDASIEHDLAVGTQPSISGSAAGLRQSEASRPQHRLRPNRRNVDGAHETAWPLDAPLGGSDTKY
jgi:hypothetical protein